MFLKPPHGISTSPRGALFSFFRGESLGSCYYSCSYLCGRSYSAALLLLQRQENVTTIFHLVRHWIFCPSPGSSNIWTQKYEGTVGRKKESKLDNTNCSSALLISTNKDSLSVLYCAAIFWHKLHIDQNEKIVMFGMTHLGNRWLQWKVAFASMPVKTNEIYKHIFMYFKR